MSTPARARGFITTLQLIFNVDNYPVLSVIDDGRTVRLDVALLREQFGDAGGRRERPHGQRRPAPARSSTRCGAAPSPQAAWTCSPSAWTGSTPALDEELDAVAGGGAVFKAVRGEYGSGKTFFARWLAERAKRPGFAAAEVQISETETPLHRLETVYRRLAERLRHRRPSRPARCGRCSTPGSTPWRRTRSPPTG